MYILFIFWDEGFLLLRQTFFLQTYEALFYVDVSKLIYNLVFISFVFLQITFLFFSELLNTEWKAFQSIIY